MVALLFSCDHVSSDGLKIANLAKNYQLDILTYLFKHFSYISNTREIRMEPTLCKHCQTPLEGSFCHKCGQPVIVGRWTAGKVFGKFLRQITDVEKGFLYTIRTLFTAPQTIIHNYWNGNTIKAYGPFRYAIIWTAINLLINFWLGIDQMLQQSLQPDMVTDEFSGQQIDSADQRFDAWLNMLVLLLIPVKSLITSWLFKKRAYNYGEHLILNTYVLGQQALITTFTQFIFYFFPFLMIAYIGFNFMIGWIYDSYVFKGVFKESWGWTVTKALLTGTLGLLAFALLIAGLSSLSLWIS